MKTKYDMLYEKLLNDHINISLFIKLLEYIK
jgi:hypothetical protein